MNSTNAIVGTILVSAGGQWSKNKKLTMRFLIGCAGLLVFAAVLNDTSSELADRFALLIFITAVFIYGPQIAKGAGLIK